jgi:hypothetical protein
MRVLGGRIPRMVFTEMIEDLFSDQDLIVSPRANRYWSEPVFLDRVRDGMIVWSAIPPGDMPI